MKIFVVLVLCSLAVLSCAEPQRYKNSRYRKRYFARQEALPQAEAVSGPYPPQGWKPEGEPFELPSETTQPTQEYGAPANEYGPPGQPQLLQPGDEYLITPEDDLTPVDPAEEQNLAEEPEDEIPADPESETFAPLATEEESGRYRTRSRYIARSRQFNSQRLRILPQKYRKARPAKLRKRF